MCTLAFAWQTFEDAPLVAAANRDEAVDRPSVPPRLLQEDPQVVAPRDEEAGGTWIGHNEHGLIAAITNRWVDLAGDRSRGLLVRDALARESAEDAARFVERAVEADDYAGFNLLVADADAVVYLEWDGRLGARNLPPGVHVVVNVGADGDFFVPEARPDAGAEQADNAVRLRAALRPEPGESADSWRDRAAAAIGDHDYGVCVHGDGFGTRSSSLVTLYADGTADFAFAPGPPCETAHEPV
ncbi:MAG: NRDE family protein [Halobacteriales archaeon]